MWGCCSGRRGRIPPEEPVHSRLPHSLDGRIKLSTNDFVQAPEPPAERAAALRPIAERLLSARSVILTTHVNADGDGVGSQVAVAAWLAEAGVRATIVNPTPYPSALRFLIDREEMVADFGTAEAAVALSDADLVLVLDTSEPNRL